MKRRLVTFPVGLVLAACGAADTGPSEDHRVHPDGKLAIYGTWTGPSLRAEADGIRSETRFTFAADQLTVEKSCTGAAGSVTARATIAARITAKTVAFLEMKRAESPGLEVPCVVLAIAQPELPYAMPSPDVLRLRPWDKKHPFDLHRVRRVD